MTFSIQQKINRLSDASAQLIKSRLLSLSNALKAEGHSGDIRDDSRLAYKWAIKETNYTQDQVVQEIVRMQNLFENTDYQIVSQKVVDLITNDLMCSYGLDQKRATIFTTRHMVPAVKLLYDPNSAQSVDIPLSSEDSTKHKDLPNEVPVDDCEAVSATDDENYVDTETQTGDTNLQISMNV